MAKFSITEFQSAVHRKDIFTIKMMMFEGNPPSIRTGFNTEHSFWDYKGGCPGTAKDNELAWARVAKNVLGLYNNKGGIIVFGIDDKNYAFVGTNCYVDSKIFNDKIRRYLGDKIWVEYHREFIQPGQSYLGIAIVPSRGPVMARFFADSPKDSNGKCLFELGGAAIRRKDSTYILSKDEADEEMRRLKVGFTSEKYAIDISQFRLLNNEYHKFVYRELVCKKVLDGLKDRRSSVVALTGIGGTGKTALATWASHQVYEQKEFSFIVSITAKDRELTVGGIQPLKPELTTYESLLDSILSVLDWDDTFSSIEDKENTVKELLRNTNGLLYVDNLETVDDPRIIKFLDELPEGVKALVTSRRSRVRVSVLPIELGPFSDPEISSYLSDLSELSGLLYLKDLSADERITIGNKCDNIPLAVCWATSRSNSVGSLKRFTDDIQSKTRHGEELLEFSYRRVFDSMSLFEKKILKTLSVYTNAVRIETILIGAGISIDDFDDSIVQLVNDVFVRRVFDTDANDYVFSILPTTRKFLVGHYDDILSEREVRKNLSDFFDAKDVKDESEREAVRAYRQGGQNSEVHLVELGRIARRSDDTELAIKYFEEALSRNVANWEAARELAEICRHSQGQIGKSIHLYQQAIQYCPKNSRLYSLINRECGMLIRQSGEINADDRAIEYYKVALQHNPNDNIAACALAQIYSKKGEHNNVIGLIEKYRLSTDRDTLRYVLPLLYKSYKHTGDLLKMSQVNDLMKKNSIYCQGI